MFEVDPHKRISCDAALKHKFFETKYHDEKIIRKKKMKK